jgi:hypothetical protein
MISGILGIKIAYPKPDIRDTLEDIDELVSTGGDLGPPITFRKMRVLNTRYAVIPSVLHPNSRKGLIQELEMSEGTPALVMDAMMSGKEALWLVSKLTPGAEATTAQKWVARMPSPSCVIGTSREGSYIAAQLFSFYR